MKHLPKYIQEPLLAREDKDNYDDIIKLTEVALKEHPEDRECLLAWQANFLRNANRPGDCLAFCTEVLPTIEDKDYFSSVLTSRATVLEEEGRLEEALADTIDLYERSGHSYFETEALAKMYKKMGDEENALRMFEILAEDQEDFDYYEKLAKTYEEKKNYKKAAYFLEKAARDNSGEVWHWCEAGRMHALGGNREEAMFMFRMVLKIDPEYASAYYYLGKCYEDEGDAYRAQANYYKALEYQPNFPEVYTNLGAITYNEDGNIKKAIEHMETALELGPDNQLKVTLCINLVRLYKQIYDYDKQEYYNTLLLQSLGFPVTIGDDDEDEEYYFDEGDEDENDDDKDEDDEEEDDEDDTE